MPIDINQLRDPARGGDPERWRDMTRKRFKPVELVDKTIDLDEKWRKAQYEMEQGRKELGKLQKEIGMKMKAKADASAELAKKADIEKELAALEETARGLEAARDAALDAIPNELDPTVPVSNDEKDNITTRMHGTPRPSDATLLHHHELLWMIDGFEDTRGADIAGHRAYFLKGPGVLLNQALINYGLAFLCEAGYTPLQPPFFMNKDVMAGVAQLGDFDEQLYKVTGETADKEKYLIATSEQPICAFHKGDWLAEKDLPKKYAGYSTCFRKEAGSHGRDSWGIFRIHQFEKIEQFIVCEPEESAAHHEALIGLAQKFYESLGFSYRVVNIVSGELNNAAAKKYDLEAWFPTLGCYRELVSASNCTDYQARAMEVRCGATKGKDDKTKKYCHFLNSTLCATERTICCLLENYQTPEGVKVPDVLVPYMGGRTFLPFTREKPVRSLTAAAAVAGGAAATGGGGAAKGGKGAATAAASGGAGAKASAPAPAPKAAAPAPAPAPSPAPVVAAAGGAGASPAPTAKPTATSTAAPTAALSPAVLGIVGKPAASSPAGLAALNAGLLLRSYVAGDAPTAEDEAVFTALTAAGVVDGSEKIKAFPNVVRWYKHVKSFSAGERAAWPLTTAQLYSGAVNARGSTLFA